MRLASTFRRGLRAGAHEDLLAIHEDLLAIRDRMRHALPIRPRLKKINTVPQEEYNIKRA